MPTIHLTTFISAPVERVFDLTRNIDLHRESMKKYAEEAVAGTRFGLLEENETVTWKARHLLKSRLLKVRMTELKKHDRFVDEQADGDFRAMKHEHYFKPCDNGTIMIDLFYYEPKYGVIGKWFSSLYLTRYLRKLLERRNNVIKEYAETDKWRRFRN